MFRKVLLVALFSAFLFGNDFWETGFVQGYSTYNIVNNQKERLLFECNESTANFYLYKKDEQININNQDISFIINNERKFTTINDPKSGTESHNQIWSNLVSDIPKAKNIIVEANNIKFQFEPSNLKVLSDFTKSCLEYENDSTSTPNNNTTPINTNPQQNTSSNNQSIDNSITLDLKMERNTYYGYYYQVLVITSLINNLEIKDVKINNGKCESRIDADIFEKNGVLRATKETYPVTIGEYDTLKVQTSKDCNIMKIDIFNFTQSLDFIKPMNINLNFKNKIKELF